ncbi:MAG: hypothetical protein R6X12_03560, partial [bacterium]
MANCKLCNKSKWLLSLHTDGICSECQAKLRRLVQSRLQVINQARELINDSTELAARLSGCDEIIRTANSLAKFELMGINISKPLPSELVARYSGRKDDLILDDLRRDLKKAAAETDPPAARAERLEALSAVLSRVRESAPRLYDARPLRKLEQEIGLLINRTQLDARIEHAEKAERDGGKQEALDSYLAALALLELELAADEPSQARLRGVRARVAALGGPPPDDEITDEDAAGADELLEELIAASPAPVAVAPGPAPGPEVEAKPASTAEPPPVAEVREEPPAVRQEPA